MKDLKKTEELTEATKTSYAYRAETLKDIYTKLLSRNVEVEIMTPPIMDAQKQYPLLILNDGQDSEAVKVKNAIERLVEAKVRISCSTAVSLAGASV